MKKQTEYAVLPCLIKRYPELQTIQCSIEKAAKIMIKTYQSGGKLLLCGNGGSAADCEHIAGELMKGFLRERPISALHRDQLEAVCGDASFADNLQGGLPAIALTGHYALSTAFSNDVNPQFVFAQQTYTLGRRGDLLLAISTSGNSKTVVNAAIVARAMGITTLGLTGANGGCLSQFCDAIIQAPAIETYQIQEYHLPIYHALCAMTEAAFFTEEARIQ